LKKKEVVHMMYVADGQQESFAWLDAVAKEDKEVTPYIEALRKQKVNPKEVAVLDTCRAVFVDWVAEEHIIVLNKESDPKEE